MRAVADKTALVGRIWGTGGVRLLLGDAVVLGLLCALVATVSLPRTAGGKPSRAEVLVSGRRAATLDLSHGGVHDVLGPIGVTRVEVRDGKVRVLSSPCPQQICRHGGWIGEPGALLVCLPNEIVVRVPGDPGDGPAAVAR